MTFPLSLALDVLVAVLLVCTIGYAIALNRRLGALRRDKSELAKMADRFQDATVKAEDSIGRLKNTAEDLHEQVNRAQALRDDLAYLIERGDSEADRLEKSVRAARDKLPAKAKVELKDAVQGASVVEAGGKDQPRSEAERELLKALRTAH